MRQDLVYFSWSVLDLQSLCRWLQLCQKYSSANPCPEFPKPCKYLLQSKLPERISVTTITHWVLSCVNYTFAIDLSGGSRTSDKGEAGGGGSVWSEKKGGPPLDPPLDPFPLLLRTKALTRGLDWSGDQVNHHLFFIVYSYKSGVRERIVNFRL